jgi:hypothetical protein
MSWSFEFSLATFLIIIIISQAISIKTRSRISLQFILGVICIFGSAAGLFPIDFIEKAKMKDIGMIMYNMLIISSGTTLDFKRLKIQWKAIALCCIGVIVVTLAVGLGLSSFIGKDLAIVSPGPVVGGGAASAIASNSLSRLQSGLAAYPWLLFMVQGFFGLPLFAWAVRKEAHNILKKFGTENIEHNNSSEIKSFQTPKVSYKRIPRKYKTAAYYLGSLMIVSVFNRWLYDAFLVKTGIGINVTALLLGIFLGQLHIMERDPLQKSGSMEFLMLGLMALMGDVILKTPLKVILSLIPAVIIVFSVSSIVLIIIGTITARVFKFSIYKGISIALSSLVGFPLVVGIVKESVLKVTQNSKEAALLESTLMPSIVASSILVTNAISILLASFLTILH